MAKSIRSKIKKRFRATKRGTVGEVQHAKFLRKTLRRLQTTLNAPGETPSGSHVDPATGCVIDGAAPTGLQALRVALGGDASTAAVAADAPGRIQLRGAEAVKAKRALRYTFNTKLREDRIAAQLEDETDDEMDVRLGRVRPSASAEEVDMGEEEDAERVEDAGVRKPADKPVRKRENGPKYKDNLRDGGPGAYETSLSRPARSKRRKAKEEGEEEEDDEPDTDDVMKKMLGVSRGKSTKAAYSFWK